MVITFVQRKKTQKYLILIFVALIIVIIFVFFSDYFKEEEIFIRESDISISKSRPSIKIDFQILDSPVFKKLTEPFPELPTSSPSEDIGRENPFLSIEESSESSSQ
jgi:hypothetical protein